ncbi:hypothetical protein FACS1894199_00780 [Bacteroidia bacterium]|nr:hypothetical protein FACS1894199_00780 [Bacteroidia bacterium]
MDWAGIHLTAQTVIITTFVVMAGLGAYLFLQRKQVVEWGRTLFKFGYPTVNWLWLLGIAAIVVVIIVNVTKTMYYPTFDTDSVRGFNLVGMAVAHEGTIKNLSIFTDVNFLPIQQAAGSYLTYVPLSQLSYAYVYMLGTETSKIVNALIFISFALSFYGVLRRFATPTLTALTTFFVLITPEMLGFSSMSGTNFTHAVYASLGILYFVSYFYKKIPSQLSLLWVSAALLMLNNWTRSEGIAFIGAAGCVLLWQSIKAKQYKQLICFGLLCIFPFLFYNIFLKVHHLESVQVFILKPFWDAEKMGTIFKEVWVLFKTQTYYGVTFVLFFFVALSNVWNIYKRRDHVVTLFLIILSWLFYTILVYQIDYIWDSILNVLRYSYKRFLFSFVPLVWFYIAVNHNVTWIFNKIDKFLFPPPYPV